jgi:hypothetical protein
MGMKQFLNFAAAGKNIVIAAEVGDDHQSFEAMRKLFALKNASHDVIKKMHRGDKEFWAQVIEYRRREAAKEAEKEIEEQI